MPAKEARRLAALRDLRTLDTRPNEAFDRITALAAELFGTPIAFVSLVDAERQWFKSRHGLEVESTPREWAFCAHAVELKQNAVMVVEDARLDPRFAANPLVTGHPDIRFYAGAVLTTREGENVGTLCVIDNQPRPRPSDVDLARLELLARIVMDEFELERATRAVSEKRRLLELAETTSGVGHWRYQLCDGAVTWSDEVYRIHGVDRDRFNPGLDDAVAFYHPDDRVVVQESIAQAIATKTGFEFQLRIIRGQDDQRDVISRAVCELDDDGGVSAVFGVFQDVTAQMRALKAVQESEQRYKQLADTVPDLIVRVVDRRVVYASSAARQYGYEPEELLGSGLGRQIHPDDRAGAAARASANAKGIIDPDLRREMRFQTKAGEWVWLEGNPTPIFAESGEVQEIINIYRNVTRRRSLEDELVVARDAAEAATAVKSEFLANMSHEIRTPLTAILGFTSLLAEKGQMDEASGVWVKRIASSGQALLSIVNDVLDLSKLEAGHFEIVPRPVNPEDVLRETLMMFCPQAEAKGLSLVLTMDEPLPEGLLIDPDRTRQILSNLIGNAIKFTDAGSVTLIASYDLAVQRFAIKVEDTGVGLSQAQQSKLFQRFSQLDATSSRRHGGTGLGLAICKGFTEAMGGSIGVNSQPGVGSTFYFDIDAPLAEPSHSNSDIGETGAGLEGVRVLVVDDNPMNRELARTLLEMFGAQVSLAEDGIVAVSKAAALPIDVILLDIRMPGMDGRSALKAIRSGIGPNRAVPILAFTADIDEDLLEDGQGFDGIVRKPIVVAELASAVRRAAQLPARAAVESDTAIAV